MTEEVREDGERKVGKEGEEKEEEEEEEKEADLMEMTTEEDKEGSRRGKMEETE